MRGPRHPDVGARRPPESVADDVRATGADGVHRDLDPQADLVLAHRLALALAVRRAATPIPRRSSIAPSSRRADARRHDPGGAAFGCRHPRARRRRCRRARPRKRTKKGKPI